jgi:hypothetical protein
MIYFLRDASCSVSRGTEESAGTWCQCTDWRSAKFITLPISVRICACFSSRPSNRTKVKMQTTDNTKNTCNVRGFEFDACTCMHPFTNDQDLQSCKKRVISHYLVLVSLHHLLPLMRTYELWKKGFICHSLYTNIQSQLETKNLKHALV